MEQVSPPRCAFCNSCSQTYLQENIKWVYYALYVGLYGTV
jgi:hypothetical protein